MATENIIIDERFVSGNELTVTVVRNGFMVQPPPRVDLAYNVHEVYVFNEFEELCEHLKTTLCKDN